MEFVSKNRNRSVFDLSRCDNEWCSTSMRAATYGLELLTAGTPGLASLGSAGQLWGQTEMKCSNRALAPFKTTLRGCLSSSVMFAVLSPQ